MKLAADGIKRLTLELGGKSPNLVFADANLDDAIPSSVWSIYYAAGQSCEARSRVLVEASIYDDFVAEVRGAREEPQGRRPARRRDAGRLAHLDRAPRPRARDGRGGREEGAEVVAGGEFGDGAGAFYLPTVLAGVDNSMTVAQEEIFGPVVTAIPFEDEKDAIRIANDSATASSPRSGRATRRAGIASRGDQVGDGRDQHAVHRVPRHPVRRLQAVGLRPRAVDTLELYLETKGVLFSTSPKPFNPFGL